MGATSAAQAASDAWGRILLASVPKGGKTVSCGCTAPPPVLIINCDRKGAAVSAVNQCKKYGRDPEKDLFIVDVSSADEWLEAAHGAYNAARDGHVRTVVVDTITLLVDRLVREIVHEGEKDLEKGEGGTQALWGRVAKIGGMGLDELLTIDAHLIVTAHLMLNDAAPGVLPAVQGSLKRWVPGVISDWIRLDVTVDKTVEKKKDADGKSKTKIETKILREFLIGAQRDWLHGSRNAKRTAIIDADITLLLEELGIRP